MIESSGVLEVDGGDAICLHTGTLVRSSPATPDGARFNLAVCWRCGAWSANLYGPATPGLTAVPHQRTVARLISGLLPWKKNT